MLGGNGNGQLGDGTTISRAAPSDVVGLENGVAAIASEIWQSAHTCALMTHGGVKCWGGNENGKLGDGSGTETDISSTSVLRSRTSPVDVIGILPHGLATEVIVETPTAVPTPTPITFIVDSTSDAVDAKPGDGACDDGAGRCTLRAAIWKPTLCLAQTPSPFPLALTSSLTLG